MLKRLTGLFVLSLGCYFSANATHLRAGEITVKRVNCSSYTYDITVTVYTNTGSPVRFGGTGEKIDFGDGTSFEVGEQPNVDRPDLGPNIGTSGYTKRHTFPGPGLYTISWREPNRNAGVLNMTNSVTTEFYIETQVNIEPYLGCNNSPVLLVPPIDQGCTGVKFEHNPGAYDPDGDSLSYELVTPFSDRDETVIGYKPPNDPSFYGGLDYQHANEAGNNPPTFNINSTTGLITWDAPGAVGEYNIAFIVREWRKVGGIWVKMGFVRRDMQIIITDDCKNNRPMLVIPNDTCVVAGSKLDATIYGTDPDNDDVKIEAFSEIFSYGPALSPATYTPNPPTYQPSSPPAELHFDWTTTCEHVKEQPYQVVFKISDNPAMGPKLVDFATWNIRVVGPPPEWKSATTNLAKRYAELQWNPYFCDNASSIQIWRRVGSFDFTPDNCETGMPDFLGYQLIDQIAARDSATNHLITNYEDTNDGKGLEIGAQYCYRLVAIFPQPKGGESYVSKDTCLAPILATAPVITHVTVDKTDADNGKITVSWRSPFDIDKSQYPGPYQYVVLRAEGPAGNLHLAAANPGKLSDTTYTDTGLNTAELTYNYRIVLWSNTTSDPSYNPIDTSAVASSVRLEAESQAKKIQLTWSANTPWSNRSSNFPYHLIYRGPKGSTETTIQLIDSVNVTTHDFSYTDHGQFMKTPLNDTATYCYRVMTRGTYGSPDIEEPLINYSEIICTQAGDTIPPCAPTLYVMKTDCGEFFKTANCNPTGYQNVIYWDRPPAACGADISGYNIYVVGFDGSDTTLIVQNWKDTVYTDTNLPSFARCYRVSAVDRSGNESDLSNEVCNENCPYYELPNVFTPNGDGCNDLFSAYSDRGSATESGSSGQCGPPPDASKSRCARFVEDVNLRIYNRWGKQVYTFQSGGEATIYIDWDGRDDQGRELATGIYYYVADVTFDMEDPSRVHQTFKGWVHLLR